MGSGIWNTTCNSTLEDLRIGSEEKIAGDLTFHQLALIIAGGSTIVAYIVSFYLMWQHALNYTKPREQKHIIRVLFMVPIYATASFLSLYFYWHAVYFQVISEAYEAFAISSFFALMCHLVAPDLHEQKNFFRQLYPIKPWLLPVNWFAKCCGGDRGCWRTPKSGLTWFNVIWVGVYQYCFIRVAMAITSVVTQYFDRYCESSNSPVFAHVWVIVIEAIAVTIAIYCLFQFYTQFRQSLAEHKLGLKILAIKLVVFLSFWQTIAISLATSSTVNLVSPNAKLAYPDLKVGIPSLLLCVEMALFAILHLWSFPYGPYKEDAKTTFYPSPNPEGGVPPQENERGPKRGGFAGLKAFADAINVWDIVKAFGRGIRWLFVGAKHRHEDPSYQLKADTSYPGPNNGKSTDHLPIANEFRRSTFGLPRAPGDPMPEESAGLIANAQPNPGSGYKRQTNPYQDSTHPQAYDDHAGQGPSTHNTTYTPYDDRGDIGAVGSQYYAYDARNAYSSHPEGEVAPGTGSTTAPPTTAPQRPRNSTQATVGNALWGHQYEQQHEGSI
ncbi:organic solute transporter Ostalpha-domain-containing protein [Xylaria arbuscula]|nr:organic solute transporter Ostalpha-domain-containing protein [Xylaria arbuscula]